LETLDDWTLALNDKASVAAVYIDYSKAFDVVCHSKLLYLYKLSVYGISGNMLAWIQDFLHERSQVTRVGGSYSKAVYLNTGVVQGSCLGPLLFLVYINNVTYILSDGFVCNYMLMVLNCIPL